MHRTLWLALASIALFSGLVVVSYVADREAVLRSWFPQFLVEFLLSLGATIYIWNLAWRREKQSWLLALLATCSLILTLGLLPATLLILAEIAEVDVLGESHPVIGIGVLMLFTGIVAPLMAGTLWWHRNRG